MNCSEETDLSEAFSLGVVMLHSDQNFPGTPEQPGNTGGTGPGVQNSIWSVCKCRYGNVTFKAELCQDLCESS